MGRDASGADHDRERDQENAPPSRVEEISGAKAKTDRCDARTLAKLLAGGLLEGTWLPSEETRALRRQMARRAQLVRQRSRLKNEVHAALYRNLAGAGSASDLFGAAGRRWLEELELPADERETVEGCLRVLDFLGAEVERLERSIARYALGSSEIRRLVTIPGVSLITAATLVAVIGDVSRFASARKLVGSLGLGPRVRQSGSTAARMGHISKEGAASARRVLCEAAHAAMRTPGPLHAFGQRVAARRGRQVAIVAVARKLASLAWRLLTSGEDYAYASPSRVALKLRRIELRAGEPRRRGRSAVTLADQREREREIALAAERAYRRLVADRQATASRGGAGAALGRASSQVLAGPSSAADPSAPASALQLAVTHTRGLRSHKEVEAVENDLTFIRPAFRSRHPRCARVRCSPLRRSGRSSFRAGTLPVPRTLSLPAA